MNGKENLQEFYDRICYSTSETVTLDKPHINIFERNSCQGVAPYSRRDYYKVSLMYGGGLLEYADKSFEIDRPAVLFSTPKVPYRWSPSENAQLGWFCILNEAFVRQQDDFLHHLPMFQIGTDKLFYPEQKTEKDIAFFFSQMMLENQESYTYKQNILRNYLHLIAHQVLKMNPATSQETNYNAAERITTLFLELLDRQFPIDSLHHQLQLKSAKDFASQLSVHTNHLNRSVKETTGETTTQHIAKRILIEATDMLRNSDWPVAEIAYCLGFEYPAYFNNFYKKHTSTTPGDVRSQSLIFQ